MKPKKTPAATDFIPTMLGFVEWFFRILDPAFTEPLFAGRSIEDASRDVLQDIVNGVRGNRPDAGTLSTADYGAIMDRVAALHLRTRHGPESVSEAVAPLS